MDGLESSSVDESEGVILATCQYELCRSALDYIFEFNFINS